MTLTKNPDCKHTEQRLRWICNHCGEEFGLKPYEKLVTKN